MSVDGAESRYIMTLLTSAQRVLDANAELVDCGSAASKVWLGCSTIRQSVTPAFGASPKYLAPRRHRAGAVGEQRAVHGA